jgi:N utilization substance protein A
MKQDRVMEVIVPDEFLSIAIGKRGQNVRLASKLTGWHIDVQSETRYSQTLKAGYESLLDLPGVGVGMADALSDKGLLSAEEISRASVEDLIQVKGVGEETAEKLIVAADEQIARKAAEAEAAAARKPRRKTRRLQTRCGRSRKTTRLQTKTKTIRMQTKTKTGPQSTGKRHEAAPEPEPAAGNRSETEDSPEDPEEETDEKTDNEELPDTGSTP